MERELEKNNYLLFDSCEQYFFFIFIKTEQNKRHSPIKFGIVIKLSANLFYSIFILVKVLPIVPNNGVWPCSKGSKNYLGLMHAFHELYSKKVFFSKTRLVVMLSIFNLYLTLHFSSHHSRVYLPHFRQVYCPFCFMGNVTIWSQCHNNLPWGVGLQQCWQIWGRGRNGKETKEKERTMPTEIQVN